MEQYETIQQETYMAALTRCLNERLLEISELHRKNTRLYQEISKVQEQLFRVEQETKALREELQSCQEQEEAVEKELCSAQEELEKTRQELHKEKEIAGQAIQENVFLQKKITQMECSKSWKITKPLRIVLWKIKGQ